MIPTVDPTHVPWPGRALAALGAVLAAISVALFAYAAHSAEPQVQASLHSAALFAFGHGIALTALASSAGRRLAMVALCILLLGTVLFSGSLVGAHAFGTPTSLAPWGGSLMILAWLLWAADRLRY